MKALVVGGNSGIGLAIVLKLIERGYEHVYVVGKDEPKSQDLGIKDQEFTQKTTFYKLNLISGDCSLFDGIQDINTLIITAGFGRVAPFNELTEIEIQNLFKCNLLSAVAIIKKYYGKIYSKEDFYCAVMGSIAGHVASPLFSVYGASKFGLCSFIENVNAELACANCNNRILDVSPGSLKGTNFNGKGNDLTLLDDVANNVLDRAFNRETLYIPQFEEVYASVIDRYNSDPKQFARQSYEYKINSGRTSNKPQVVVGYLSGTFDLFHIGHLNLLKRAKEQCDYLIVGIHKSGAWKGKETFIPFEERRAIVESIRYVDLAIESFSEDADAYSVYHYDKLFVGSDYKGSERFLKYEEFFKDKGVEIVYFPYTKGTSSTQLREKLKQK